MRPFYVFKRTKPAKIIDKMTHLNHAKSHERTSGGIKRGGIRGICPPSRQMLCLPRAPPPPRQKKKWPKSAIFGKFLDFCPLRITFSPLNALHKKNKILVPPLERTLVMFFTLRKVMFMTLKNNIRLYVRRGSKLRNTGPFCQYIQLYSCIY